MYKVHRALGIASVAVIAFHLYLYFGKAAKSILGWWGGYVALTSFGIATISGLAFLTPKVEKGNCIWSNNRYLVTPLKSCSISCCRYSYPWF